MAGHHIDEHRILESAFCAMLDNPPSFPLWEVSSLVFFAIPMAVMVVLYGRMGLQIRFRAKHTSVLGEYAIKRAHRPSSIILLSVINKIQLIYYLNKNLGVQQGSQHGESKHAQNRRAIVRMLGKY